MPIGLTTYNRRTFLKTAALGLAGLYVGYHKKTYTDKFILISDTHIHSDLNHERRGVNLADNLKAIIQKIINEVEPPTGVIINGDLARTRGRKGDYISLHKLLEPILLAGIPVYLTLGNHDNREEFKETLPEFESEYISHIGRHVLLIETSASYLLLLDSLDKVNEPPGRLGEDQLYWISGLLSTVYDKPVIIFAHHFPETGTGSGLQDYGALHEIMMRNKNVKAFIHGHSHRWEILKKDSVYHISLPSTAYSFQQEQPLGYVYAEFSRKGLSLELECLDQNHPWHKEKGYLAYSNLDMNNRDNGRNGIFVDNPAPNPFNSYTNVRFKLSEISKLSVDVYSMDGRYVKSLQSERNLIPGEHRVQLRADGLSSGNYLIRFQTENQIETKIVTLIK